MSYGIENTVTKQVEQIVEDTKAEAQKLCRILNKDHRTRAAKDAPIEPPMVEGERVTYTVVDVDDPPEPGSDDPPAGQGE